MRSILTGPIAKGILGGAIGVALMLMLVHAYFDHRGFHELVNAINTAAAAKPPQP